MPRRVVVTGMGTVNPLGKNVKDFWQAVRAGENGITPLTRFDAADFSAKIAGQVHDWAPEKILEGREARRMDRFIQFAVVSAVEAMADVVGQTRRLVISSAVAPGVVRIVFRDNGPGVADDLFDGVFEPFYTTKPQGMGMGLAISRSIIESHGGRVGCENHTEGGAVFWFTLPT